MATAAEEEGGNNEQLHTRDECKYLDLLRDIVLNGTTRMDRTGTGTRSVFGRQLHFDLSCGNLPMITTRFTSFKIILHELLFFLSGSTDSTRYLEEKGIRIWSGNTSRSFLDSRGLRDLPEGDIGAGYGFQWRHYGAEYGTCKDDYDGKGIDQLAEVLHLLKTDPFSRRICMTAWNPVALARMALPPCHSCFVQFYVDEYIDDCGSTPPNGKKQLSCHMYQRSVDCFLGLAINIPSYALLTAILANMCDMTPRELVISTGDTHIYSNHIEQVHTQLGRNPLPSPKLIIKRRIETLSDISTEDFDLVGYMYHPSIKAPMAV